VNLHIFSTTSDDFDNEEYDRVYVVESAQGVVELLTDSSAVTLVTQAEASVDEDLLDSVGDLIIAEDPEDYVLSRAMPGDVALMSWDESQEAYDRLRTLNRSGVTVLDPDDDYVEVVLDKNVDLEDLVDLITRRVTTDVLQTLREEFDAPTRRSKFRSRPPRA
jgi:hypothetical protein